VEWSSPSGLNSSFADSITFIGDVAVVSEIDGSDLLRINFDGTPEQAIAATLGRGECKVDVLNTGDCAGYECSEYIMHCNGCGHEFGHVLYNEDGDVWMSEPPNYCPNCGAKIVDPTTNDVDAEVDA
jgi:DNA-directed RNA polymerase subunit RPC12/RpoP